MNNGPESYPLMADVVEKFAVAGARGIDRWMVGIYWQARWWLIGIGSRGPIEGTATLLADALEIPWVLAKCASGEAVDFYDLVGNAVDLPAIGCLDHRRDV